MMPYGKTKPTKRTYEENEIPTQTPIPYKIKTSSIIGLT